MRVAPGVAVAAVAVVVAGCLSPGALYHDATGGADPPRDVLGWEAGYWHDEALAASAGDGLNDSELDAVVARSMARVEHVRRLEFREPVPVEVLTRTEFRERWGGGGRPATYHAWNDQVWEALFVVDEASNASRESGNVFGASVVGFYAPGNGSIVLVSDDPDTLRVDPSTLVHELVHALQDQRLRLGFGRTTRDGRLAADGLVEGDANYVEYQYRRRCGQSWRCLERPPRDGGGTDLNRGLFLTVFVPYSEGPRLVAELRARGGWAAVNDAYDDPPVSTEQVVHPAAYPADEPVDVAIPDRSGPDWTPFGPPGRDAAAERVGEAAVLVMLWAGGGVPDSELRSDDPLSPYDYDAPASAGWEGDAVVPYRDGERFGYVFRTEWESPGDAREFRDAYVAVLRANGASARGGGVYRIPEGEPFADAFRVSRSGTTVTVVNAPTVAELDAVHAEGEPDHFSPVRGNERT